MDDPRFPDVAGGNHREPAEPDPYQILNDVLDGLPEARVEEPERQQAAQMPQPPAAPPTDVPSVTETPAAMLNMFRPEPIVVPHRQAGEVLHPLYNYMANHVNQRIMIPAEYPRGNLDPVGAPQIQLKPQEIVARIIEMYPKVDPRWVQEKVAHGWSLQLLADFMLEPSNKWPKLEQKRANQATSGGRKSMELSWAEFRNPASEYVTAAVRLLGSEYSKVGIESIRRVLRLHNNHYSPAKKAIEEGFEASGVDRRRLRYDTQISVLCALPGQGKSTTVILKMLKGRNCCGNHAVARLVANGIPELRAELEWVQKKEEDNQAQGQSGIAVATTSSAPPDSGSDLDEFYECPICYVEAPLRECSGCSNDHIFCHTCIMRHAKEVAYGQGRPMVDCLETDCKATIPQGTLDRILDTETLGRLEERFREESLNGADIEGLEKCKYCSYAMVFDVPKEVDKVFRCQNPDCMMEVCRQCGLDWGEDHLGVPCQEMERDEAMQARREYEEKMTLEVIRTCQKCKIPIQKIDGCNKMTCRCGQTMCYLCRKSRISYKHFCHHPRTPGVKGCDKCTGCFLFEDDKKYDLNRLQELERQAFEDERIDATHSAGLKVPTIPAPPKRALDPNNNELANHREGPERQGPPVLNQEAHRPIPVPIGQEQMPPVRVGNQARPFNLFAQPAVAPAPQDPPPGFLPHEAARGNVAQQPANVPLHPHLIPDFEEF